jgi:hypothetical protein
MSLWIILVIVHVIVGVLYSSFCIAHEEVVKEKYMDADDLLPFVFIGIFWEFVLLFLIAMCLWRLPYFAFKKMLIKRSR